MATAFIGSSSLSSMTLFYRVGAYTEDKNHLKVQGAYTCGGVILLWDYNGNIMFHIYTSTSMVSIDGRTYTKGFNHYSPGCIFTFIACPINTEYVKL